MEKKFKVGDRVEFISNDGYQLQCGNFPDGIKGNYGTVALYMHRNKYKVLVDGQIRDTPWTFFAKSFKLIDNNLKSKIGKALKNYGTTKAYRKEVMTHLEDATFYQDDKLTFLKTDKGTGYALRNPEDVNDAEKGIYLAVTRIFGETKPKWQSEVDECVKKGDSVKVKLTLNVGDKLTIERKREKVFSPVKFAEYALANGGIMSHVLNELKVWGFKNEGKTAKEMEPLGTSENWMIDPIK